MKKKFLEDELDLKYFLTLFIIYIVLLIWVIIFKCGIPKEILGTGYSLDPMSFGPETQKYMELSLYDRFLYDFNLRHDSLGTFFSDLFLNILVFLPFGILFPVLIKRHNIIKTIISGFALSLSFELIQLFTLIGGFSFLDLLFNVLGTCLGIVLNKLLMNLTRKKSNFKFVNKVTYLTIGLFLLVIVGAIIYTGINFNCLIYRLSYK